MNQHRSPHVLLLLLPLLPLLMLPLGAQVPGTPVFRLRADMNVTAANSLVSSWADADNGRSALQGTAAAQPSLIPGALNGLPVVRFSGAQYMECSPVYPVSRDYTLSFVVRIRDFAVTNNMVSGTTHAVYLAGKQYPIVLHGNFSTIATSSVPLDTSSAIVTVLFRQGNQYATVYLNGLLADSAYVGTNLDSTMELGAFQASNFLIGDIAEVVLYNRLLNVQERKQLESYLFNRYAIPIPPQPPPPDTTFHVLPGQMALYPRDRNDSAAVPVAGRIYQTGYDSVYVEVRKNNAPWKRVAQRLRPDTFGSAPFYLAPTIHAELSEYRFTVGLRSADRDTVLAVRDSIVCGDVYLVDGQSNTVVGSTAVPPQEFCRTFGINFSQNPRDTTWGLSDGRLNGGGRSVGGWVMRLQQQIQDKVRIPTCFINGGVGGTAVEQHQRNDVAPYTLSSIYGSLLYRVEKAGLRRAARAMFWYQGESNSAANYYPNFRAMYDDWNMDYPNLKKFYVIQIRPGCGGDLHAQLREIQRELPDSLPNILVHAAAGLPGHDGCHYAPAGYTALGDQVFRLVARDFYGSADTQGINSPTIRKAFYTTPAHDEIALVFPGSGGILSPPDTTAGGVTASLKDYIYLNDSSNVVRSVRASGDTLFLSLISPSSATSVSYTPDRYYTGTTVIYEGPWLRGIRGVGALTFWHVPVTERDVLLVDEEEYSGEGCAALLVAPNPSTGNAVAHVRVTRRGPVRLTICDVRGGSVRTIAAGMIDAGDYTVALPAGLAQGVYYLRLATPGMTGVRLVFVVR